MKIAKRDRSALRQILGIHKATVGVFPTEV